MRLGHARYSSPVVVGVADPSASPPRCNAFGAVNAPLVLPVTAKGGKGRRGLMAPHGFAFLRIDFVASTGGRDATRRAFVRTATAW